MLPSKTRSHLCICKSSQVESMVGALYNDESLIDVDHEDFEVQHLYIISDDEIKDGDWKYNAKLNQVWQHNREGKNLPNELKHAGKDTLKVITSTDSSLKMKGRYPYFPNIWNRVPSIPQSFIERYVSEYNKGNILEDVEVEYDSIPDNSPTVPFYRINLHLNPDNTISIKSIKDSWTRKEVEKLCRAARESMGEINIDDWIKKNL